MAKVLFVGYFVNHSDNISHASGIERCGVEVVRYDYRVRNAVLGSEGRDIELIETIHRERPDLTVFAKCNGVGASPLLAANEVGQSCLWYMDPKNRNYSEGLIEKIEAASFCVFALQEPLDASMKYNERCFFIAEGYDDQTDYPFEGEREVFDVSFIGSFYGNRRELAESVNAVHIVGAYGREHCRAVARSRINLNFTMGGTSNRTYRILSARGFLLTQRWPRMFEDQGFVEGEHLDAFDTEEELKEKVSYYLRSPSERERIATQGYEYNKRYTRVEWGRRVLELAGLSD